MGAKVALTNYNLPFDASKLKNFDTFHDKYGKYIIQAMEGEYPGSFGVLFNL
jgi:hypothetical protein